MSSAPGSAKPKSTTTSSSSKPMGLSSNSPPAGPGEEGEDEDDVRLDVAFIQGFASKIQLAPSEIIDGAEVQRPRITIPKRGEKDFEPLQETVNLQEMMLQNSRQALFDALQGVRGMSSKSLSHAIVTPESPYPRLVVARGHVLDTMGISVRSARDGAKSAARVQLLPEEAIYLTERGSLQIWNGRSPANAQEEAEGIGAWSDEEFGIRDAVEMSVMEVYGAFMGMDGLTWQRYQAFAYLRRLGYTVQRVRQFIPTYFLSPEDSLSKPAGVSLGLALRTAGEALARIVRALVNNTLFPVRFVTRVGLSLASPFKTTGLRVWHGKTYSSLFASLRCIPGGHQNPVPASAMLEEASVYDNLARNPYLPFYHVWKPATTWSKNNWDKGSAEGLDRQKPEYTVAVVESRDTPFPTLEQLDEVFNMLPDEPTGPANRVGPQYSKPNAQVRPADAQRLSFFQQMMVSLGLRSVPSRRTANPMGALRNGDRALVVAVNDCGNTGWIRFGRSGFESIAMV